MAKENEQSMKIINCVVSFIIFVLFMSTLSLMNRSIAEEIEKADAVLSKSSHIQPKSRIIDSELANTSSEGADKEKQEKESSKKEKQKKQKIIYEFPITDVNLLQ